MTRFATVSLVLLALAVLGATPVLAGETKADQERQDICTTGQDILARPYKAQPSAKAAIEKAAGYAVFSNSGWELEGQTSAAAKAGETGAALHDALDIAPGVRCSFDQPPRSLLSYNSMKGESP